MRGNARWMTPAPNGLLGMLRSWFGGGTSGVWHEAREPALMAPMHMQMPMPRPLPHSYGRASVLVADDNPVNLMLIAALLESRGLFPTMAADGAEAVALASEMSFDLILMDLQMPVLDGLGATAAIRRFERAAGRPEVPVVAYSSALPPAVVLASCGISGNLCKPCSDQDLENCLVLWCPDYRAAPPVDGCGGARTEQRLAPP